MSLVAGWWSRNLPIVERKCEEVFPDMFTGGGRLAGALQLARASHHGQFRKGERIPYIIHPLRVALWLACEFCCQDPEMIEAALLHDVIEDCDELDGPKRVEAVRARGGRVLALVRAVTRQSGDKRGPKGDEPGSPYLQRVKAGGADAVLLKFADKLDNLKDSQYLEDVGKAERNLLETYRAYLPLLDVIPPVRRLPAERVILNMAAALPGQPRTDHLLALVAHLERAFEHAPAGAITSRDVPDHHRTLCVAGLLNPDPRAWIEDDGVQVAQKPLIARHMAASLCGRLVAEIESPRLRDLLALAGIPPAFGGENFRGSWQRVARQWRELHGWLTGPTCPGWFSPLKADRNLACLILLIQSRLFLPANWAFPLWLHELGPDLTAGFARLFPAFSAGADTGCTWEGILRFLLTARLGVHRYITGLGTGARLDRVVKLAQSLPLPPDTLWSLRLTAEYLELSAQAGPDVHRELQPAALRQRLDDLWPRLVDQPFAIGSLKPALQPVLAAGALGWPPTAFEGMEWGGLIETGELFRDEGMLPGFGNLLRQALRFAKEAGAGWVSFDLAEWRKRRHCWAAPGAFTADGVIIEEAEVEAQGARFTLLKSEDGKLLLVQPARHFALRDRLPEMTDAELAAIAAAGFSACAIFDQLLVCRLDDPERGPVWVPRVYRVLDSMEDLDPSHVQAITVGFEADEEVKSLPAFLPLPATEAEAAGQARRKPIVGHYLVAQVYNHAISRRIRRARAECAPARQGLETTAFTEAELARELAAAEAARGYRQRFGFFVDQFCFAPFDLAVEPQQPMAVVFTPEDMRWGRFLGIDIGGTGIKFCLFDGGQARSDVSQVPTFRTVDEKPAVEDFCRRVIEDITATLGWTPSAWCDLDGVGLSWAGAVRNNRIAGFSGTLGRLVWRKEPFAPTDRITRLAEFDFAHVFREVLAAYVPSGQLKPDCPIAMENDGNAEALGNYCARALEGVGGAGGKIFLKLGTSLAGGRITRLGVVADDIAEYSKVTLDLKAPLASQPTGVAREHVSSFGVRALTRTFTFQGRRCFEAHSAWNDETDAHRHYRIESAELGHSLATWRSVPGHEALLEELTATDNADGGSAYIELRERILSPDFRPNLTRGLVTYVRALDPSKQVPQAEDVTGQWRRQFLRATWLFTGKTTPRPDVPDGAIPDDFPIAAFAEFTLLSVAMFSELALRLAHLVASLYNVYRRDTFDEVILSGGVLSNETGPLVVEQARAFLKKYYDKIIGPRLPEDAVKLAGVGDPEITGPLGAAMTANRVHKTQALRQVRAALDRRIAATPVGDVLNVANAPELMLLRVPKETVAACRAEKLAAGVLSLKSRNPDIYVRCQ